MGRGLIAMLAILDTALCLFVFFPLSVLHWRGTWDLLDVYIIPDDLFYSSWVTLSTGGVACVFCYLVQPQLTRCAAYWGRVAEGVVTRVYMYVFSWAVLGYWRGVWNLMDIYMGDEVPNSLLFYGLGVALAALFRSMRTIAGIPLQVQIDTDPEIMKEPDTRFKVKPTDMGMFLLDICFSQFVLVTLAIFVWRGIWNVLDHCLFPDDLLLSDVVSLVGGYVILILLFVLQYPASLLSSCLDKHPVVFKILYEDAIMVCATWGILMLWRGAWDLVHAYFLPDRLVGGWVCHAIGVLGLLLLQGFGNVGINGIDIDGSYTGGAGIFQTHYLRLIFGEENKDEKEKDELADDKERLLPRDEDDEAQVHLLVNDCDEEEEEELYNMKRHLDTFKVVNNGSEKIELREVV